MRNWIHYNEVNEAMNCQKSIKNQIIPDMGATMFVGSDTYAMVVTEVISPKKIKVAHVLDSHEDKFVEDENGIHATIAGLPKQLGKYITFENFKEGFSVKADDLEKEHKLSYKKVKGGVLLVDTDFTIK